MDLLITAAACNFSVYIMIEWDPANIYLFKFNTRNTRERCELCSKVTVKTVENHFDVFIVNFKQISYLFLMFLLLARNK